MDANGHLEVAAFEASQKGHMPLRILAVSALWQGANDYAFVRAFRRAGHSVTVVPEEWFIPPGWRHKGLRVLRRLLTPALVAEFNAALIAEANKLRPHLFFVFKGAYVTAEALLAVRNTGAVAINYYPDTGFLDHGPYIGKAIPGYDWIFTTKSFGLADLRKSLRVNNASFLPHAFDPETHAPVVLDETDRKRLDCDFSFIGGYSPKKEFLLTQLARALPERRMRVWGGGWNNANWILRTVIEGQMVTGTEYAKSIGATRVNIAILFEGTPSAPNGDLITARTFEIPAASGFMLHERTDEAMQYFTEGKECAFFSDAGDLVTKIDYYLRHPEERRRIAAAGRQRCLDSGYSVDARAQTVLAKYRELRAAPSAAPDERTSHAHRAATAASERLERNAAFD